MIKNFLFCYFILCASAISAQSTRLSNYNHIGWFGFLNTIKINEKWSAHAEFQWRRDEYVNYGQQNLVRTGINYDGIPNCQIRIGVANAVTFPYGEFPINSFGKTFSESRMFEMISFNQKISKLNITNRIMLEQRWTEKYSSKDLLKADLHRYSNRARFMFRMQMPLGKQKMQKSYAAAYDEVFIGFGKNVGENIFDQNRTGLLLGRTFSKVFRMEGGYFCQLVQLSREIENKNLIQYNQGFIINSYFNIDASHRKKN